MPPVEGDQEGLAHQVRRGVVAHPPGEIAVQGQGIVVEQPAELDRRIGPAQIGAVPVGRYLVQRLSGHRPHIRCCPMFPDAFTGCREPPANYRDRSCAQRIRPRWE
jgi:hypothetical protein